MSNSTIEGLLEKLAEFEPELVARHVDSGAATCTCPSRDRQELRAVCSGLPSPSPAGPTSADHRPASKLEKALPRVRGP